jgi:hypothetical protein
MSARPRDRRPPHAQIFFPQREILGYQTKSKQSKAESFQRSAIIRIIRLSIYFQAGSTGGRVESFSHSTGGPVGKARTFFREFSKTFFCFPYEATLNGPTLLIPERLGAANDRWGPYCPAISLALKKRMLGPNPTPSANPFKD